MGWVGKKGGGRELKSIMGGFYSEEWCEMLSYIGWFGDLVDRGILFLLGM